MAAHVAILLPSAGQRALANLARDAIAKFTTDVFHEVWLLDTAPDLAHGSDANGRALDRLIRAAAGKHGDDVSHVFLMHDDALPLRSGWLSYLLSKPGPIVGVKASERNGYAHGSGVLLDITFALTHSMIPGLPHRDVAEFPPNWVAASYCHRPWMDTWPDRAAWWAPFSCDVSFDESGDRFYAHFGGGTLNDRPDRDAWIRAAREALGLGG